MAIRELSLSELQNLDAGRIAVAFQEELKRAAEDCEDRPGEQRARVVTLQCEVTPVCDEDGLCEEVRTKFQVRSKVPTRKSKVYTMGLRKGGKRAFSDASNDGSPSMFDGE